MRISNFATVRPKTCVAQTAWLNRLRKNRAALEFLKGHGFSHALPRTDHHASLSLHRDRDIHVRKNAGGQQPERQRLRCRQNNRKP
jgi:hypothetical protein